MWQTLQASLEMAADPGPGRQPWVLQLQSALQHIGVQFDPQERQRLDQGGVGQAALAHYLQQVAAAVQDERHTVLRHYFRRMRPDGCDPARYGMADELAEVRGLRRRSAWTELATGCSWGAETAGRRTRTARAARVCGHCGRGIEGAFHIIFDCPLYAELRTVFAPALVFSTRRLHAFRNLPPAPRCAFAAACRKLWMEAYGPTTSHPAAASHPTHDRRERGVGRRPLIPYAAAS